MHKLNIKILKEVEEKFGEFDLGQVSGSNEVYLRFGYWKHVDLIKLQEIIGNFAQVVEDSDYDDDCGWLYNYKLI